MNIYELHFEGGILFMGILSLVFFSVLIIGIFSIINRKIFLLKLSQELGLFALVWGVLGQMLGMLQAFAAIEAAGEVSQAMVAGGLRVSSYTTAYGLIIFLIAKLIKIIYLGLSKY